MALLDELPLHCTLVVISRSVPPIYKTAQRASGEVLELRADDLRFDDQTAGELLSSRSQLRLSNDQISMLVSKTEGWAVGLQLAALDANAYQDADVFLGRFKGDSKSIVEYLFAEVYTGLDEVTKRFLAATSVTERICGELAAEILGYENVGEHSGDTLLQLEERGLFIEKLNPVGGWFRYHPLFREFLYGRLRHGNAPDVKKYHTRAARWFAKAGEPRLALEQFFAAGDFADAALLLEQLGPDLFWRNADIRKTYDYLRRLPNGVRTKSPRLMMLQSWVNYFMGRTHGAPQLIDEAKRLVSLAHKTRDEDDGRFSDICSELSTLECFSAARHGYRERMSETLDALLERKSGKEFDREHNVRHAVIAEASAHNGQLDAAKRSFETALAGSYLQGDRLTAQWAATRLAELAQMAGSWREAQKRTRELERLVEGGELDDSLTSLALFLRAEGKRHGGHVSASISDYKKCVSLIEDLSFWMLRDALHGFAMAYCGIGEYDLAMQSVQRAVELEIEYDMYPDWCYGAATDTAAFIAARCNKLSDARRWLEGVGRFEWASPTVQAKRHLIRAYILVELGDELQALHEIETLRRGFSGPPTDIHLHRSLLLEAAIQHRLGDLQKAESALRRAVRVANETGRFGPIVEAGAILPRLLTALPEGSWEFAELHRILDSIHIAEESPAEANDLLATALSLREKQVLGLIAEGLRNKQIADQLFLSPHTVKAHTTNIYRKLDVQNRAEAVAKAASQGVF